MDEERQGVEIHDGDSGESWARGVQLVQIEQTPPLCQDIDC